MLILRSLRKSSRHFCLELSLVTSALRRSRAEAVCALKIANMKNKVKFQIFTIALAILIAPSLVYAAWWKPWTWFTRPTLSVQTTQVQNVSPTTPPTKPVVATPAPLVKKETPAVVVKPVVTPPVKTTDQSAEIEKLKTEVTELRKQQSQQTTKEEKALPAPIPVINTPPPNTTFCNGTNWTRCPSGQDFVCPASGKAYCRLPQQPTPTPAEILQQNPVAQEIISRARKIDEIDRQISSVKQQYNSDLQNLQNTLTPTQKQVQDAYIADKTAYDDLNQELAGKLNDIRYRGADLAYTTGLQASLNRQYGSQLQALADRVQGDIQMIQLANQEKVAMIQLLTNDANQKLTSLQNQREQIR